jgi:hypothetical protein
MCKHLNLYTSLTDNGGIKLKRKIVTIIICILLSTVILPVVSSIPSKTADETHLHEVFKIQEDSNFFPRAVSEFTDDFIIDIIEQLDETMYLSYLEDIVDFGPRVTGTPACHDAGNYIYNEFQSMDLEVRYHDWNYGGYEDRNIEATLTGTDNTSDEIYILCAHYDTVSNCPGADDDASGVATVLAAAYILSQHEFNHTIRFVTFSGEEQWMLGSHEYVMEAVENEDNIIAVLNVDMIGFALTSTHGSNIKIFKNPPSLWISDYTIDIAEEYYEYIHLNVLPLGEAPSDQLYFWENGFDAVFYHEYEFNDYYHTPNDIIENMNITYATRFSKLVLATLAELAVANEVVENQPPDTPEISGQTNGATNTSYLYTFVTTDDDGDYLFYYIDWGDGEVEEWIGPYESDESGEAYHLWEEEDTYTIKIKAKDTHGDESNWTYLEVSMPVNQMTQETFLQRVLNQFPNAFAILRYLLGL